MPPGDHNAFANLEYIMKSNNKRRSYLTGRKVMLAEDDGNQARETRQ